MSVRILFIGDIVGSPGRSAISRELHRLVDRHAVDLVIANGENAAGGFGITPDTAEELFRQGICLLTSGNHIWDKKDTSGFLDREERIIRPLNYPPGTPGRGAALVETPGGITVGVLNLEGRVYMKNLDCPFRTADAELARLKKITPIVLVDIHAEATSEKSALGWYLDGRVSAVVGTHTHVQTADERILPGGTAYLTDVGMTGSFDSVIGIDKHQAIQRFLTQQPVKFDVPKKDLRINAVVIGVETATGKAVSIERINVPVG
ncbi:TIGR00282 family metallophosphoesterase [Trichlorobacter ammonificans]|uniref:2',3'-cyclic-nucleotide 2'-phosphodiesterase n=1 Tax=Trichlorobacter ammonificans TaxID=2916410 RepID=A0ABN8HJ03_9BACT|nr:TIGR00282 family metallophosphoesterase [Trichlorobacter ammonificans]CAH2032692.1 2',3'-cyclic-nucleotide 2'-phosphodiesterase [Trichlorobacter ammonificans]